MLAKATNRLLSATDHIDRTPGFLRRATSTHTQREHVVVRHTLAARCHRVPTCSDTWTFLAWLENACSWCSRDRSAATCSPAPAVRGSQSAPRASLREEGEGGEAQVQSEGVANTTKTQYLTRRIGPGMSSLDHTALWIVG